MYKKFMKRFLDIIVSFFGIIILAPILLVLSIIIKLSSPGPVLFKQERIGKNKKHFKIYKFRSMRIDAPKDMPTHLFDNPDQYITSVGRFMRKTSLDELPQLFNIFIGNMSIVGPRPALWNQEDLIEERDKYLVNDIRPGLTGWAQINGRDELTIEAKVKLDSDYIKSMSFLFDIKCFIGTFKYVLKSDGVVEGGTSKLSKEEHK